MLTKRFRAIASTVTRTITGLSSQEGQVCRADSEHGPSYYDEAYSTIESYHSPFWQSPYYFIWTVIADRIRCRGLRQVLEVGCGPGQLAALLREVSVTEYVGFDFSQVAITIARTTLPGTRFERDDARTSQLYTTWPCDAIVCTEVLEHIDDDLTVVGHFPPGVRCFVTVPSFPYKSHVRFFRSVQEVNDRYGQFFDDITVSAFRMPKNADDRLYLLEGTRNGLVG